jgi:two-component system chemotaxis response regulator CheY
MRILIVDDDTPNRKLLTDIVSKLGECEAVAGGQEALSAFKKAWEDWRPFNLIFLDILMPEMDGKEVLHKIRKIEKDKKISEQHQARIIMVTGVSEEEMVMACLKNGCDDFLVKPIESNVLFDKINHLALAKAN